MAGVGVEVYQRQPERIDAEVIAAGLMLECVSGCGRNRFPEPPVLHIPSWLEATELRAIDVFRAGARLAILRLAALDSTHINTYNSDSYVALVRSLTDDVATQPDPELAAAVASIIVATDPMEAPVDWLASSLDHVAGPGASGAAWMSALARAPGAEPNVWVWDRAVTTLTGSPAPSD